MNNKFVTYSLLAEWLAKGNGVYRTHNGMVYSHFDYTEKLADASVELLDIEIKWFHSDEWMKPSLYNIYNSPKISADFVRDIAGVACVADEQKKDEVGAEPPSEYGNRQDIPPENDENTRVTAVSKFYKLDDMLNAVKNKAMIRLVVWLSNRTFLYNYTNIGPEYTHVHIIVYNDVFLDVYYDLKEADTDFTVIKTTGHITEEIHWNLDDVLEYLCINSED